MKQFFSRIFRAEPDPREALRPLWGEVVALSRRREYYAEYGVADTIAGRFDMLTAVLALVLLRMEKSERLIPYTALLTELFVEDMDGQVRQIGVGDLVVGKQMGKLMASMGGRLGAYREALAAPLAEAALAEALMRNMTMIEGASAANLAGALRELAARLERSSDGALLSGEIAP